MTIVAQNHVPRELLSTKILSFFHEFHIGELLKACNAYKARGFRVISIFLVAFFGAFLNRSFYQQKKDHPDSIPFEQDTFYQFLNSSNINWRRFTLLLGKSIIDKALAPLTDASRRNVLIIDDSLFSRGRSKKVELLAKVFDHVSHTYVNGFRMLTLGWSDGNTFLPLSHCLLSSTERSNRYRQASAAVDPRSNGGKQRKLAQSKSPDVAFELLKENKAAGIQARHVLFDSWFCSPSMLIRIKGIGYDVIAMTKKTESIHFRYEGRMQSAPAIYRKSKKRPGCAKYLLSVEAEAVKDGDAIPVRLVFVRNRNKHDDYLILVSTDMELSEEEIIQTYGKRWNIEVFFKTCKSYLKLGKESHSLSYDAMTAHVAIVFSRYMMMALERRRNVDNRSLGDLFYTYCEELQDMQYIDALALLLKELVIGIKKEILFDDKELNKLLNDFIEQLPTMWSRCLKQCA